MKLTSLTGLLFIIVPVAFNVIFFLLQRAFEYPDILRKPTDYILNRFKEGARLCAGFGTLLPFRQSCLLPSQFWHSRCLGQMLPGILPQAPRLEFWLGPSNFSV